MSFLHSGPDLASLWLGMALGWGCVIVLVYTLAWFRRGNAPTIARELTPSELAFLAGGRVRAVRAALEGLRHRGAIDRIGDRYLASSHAPSADTTGPQAELEQCLLAACATSRSLGELVQRARTVTSKLQDGLARRGLLVRGRALIVLLLIVPAGIWLWFGAIALAVAWITDPMLRYLLPLCVLPLAVGPFYLRPPRLTRLGKRVRIDAEWQTYGLEQAARTDASSLSATEVARVVALFGPDALVSRPRSP